MEYTRRYLMDGLHNLRDLGGYAVPGGITRFGVLLRSDLPWHLTEDDGKRFAALEVRHTLDLRDVDESESMPDELALLRGVAYRQIAMKKVPRAVARNRPGGLSAFDEAFFWGDEYIRMLEDNHPWAKECAEFLAAAEGTVLFHCFTGKDRTGIIAKISNTLYEHQVNIVDISQNVMEDMFAMVMLVNIDKCTVDFNSLIDLLDRDGEELGMKIHTMHEDIFDAMHKI